MARRPVLIAVLLLAFPATALAHEAGSGSFTSAVTSIRPSIPVDARVIDGDDRLRLENRSDRTVVVDGYGGEPYLRFTANGVFENQRSPAAYLNRDRWAETDVPASARESGRPRWRRVADGDVYEWFDHRIHWMSRDDPPPVVKSDPDSKHRISTWAVPGRFGTTPFTISGTLSYAPSGSDFPWAFATIFGTLLLGLVVGLLVIVRVRRTPT